MNKKLLKAKMKEGKLTTKELAKRMEMPASTLYTKLRGNYDFKLFEIRLIAEILKLSINEIKEIFFEEKVS